VTAPTRVAWTEQAAQLRAHPGEWFPLVTRPTRHGARSLASQINRGALYAWRPAGDFEARAEGLEVHARFLGDG
jgi:hypothetical protein